MKEVKRALSAQFEVKDLGDLHYFLGVAVNQNQAEKSMWIDIHSYKIGIKEAKPIATPVNTYSKPRER